MVWKNVMKTTFLTSVGVGGWILGTLSERRKCYNLTSGNIGIFQQMPGLPIFGTVSAASLLDNRHVLTNDELIPAPQPKAPSRVSQIMRFGFPGLDNIRAFEDYVLSYDRRNRVAHWVFEHLTAESVKHNDAVDRSKCQFAEDESIHPYFRSTNTDYRGSGFDRGHMAAAGNHRYNQKHVDQTFLLSNMAPQVGIGFNRHSWNRLEKHIRRLTRTYINVYVCTGPLYLPRYLGTGNSFRSLHFEFLLGRSTIARIIWDTCVTIWEMLREDFMKEPNVEDWMEISENYERRANLPHYVKDPSTGSISGLSTMGFSKKEADGKTYISYQVIGTNTVAVPTHFFKVVIGEKKDQTLEMEAYVMPNQPITDETPLNVFQVPPESIERASGLLFFDGIARDKLRVVNGRKTTYL